MLDVQVDRIELAVSFRGESSDHVFRVESAETGVWFADSPRPLPPGTIDKVWLIFHVGARAVSVDLPALDGCPFFGGILRTSFSSSEQEDLLRRFTHQLCERGARKTSESQPLTNRTIDTRPEPTLLLLGRPGSQEVPVADPRTFGLPVQPFAPLTITPFGVAGAPISPGQALAFDRHGQVVPASTEAVQFNPGGGFSDAAAMPRKLLRINLAGSAEYVDAPSDDVDEERLARELWAEDEATHRWVVERADWCLSKAPGVTPVADVARLRAAYDRAWERGEPVLPTGQSSRDWWRGKVSRALGRIRGAQ